LHQHANAKQLFEIVADEKGLLPDIIEKDYWLMHCLWGIQQQKYQFELKGGTSLSKGFGIIERFSEDIDIQIHPNDDSVKTGKNHDKTAHIESRKTFFDKTAKELNVSDLNFERDDTFDDQSGKMRGAGIKAVYTSFFNGNDSLKSGVILELGFDQTTPFVLCDITSWAYEKAVASNILVIDNRAKMLPCYCPEYTFVEKLQTISTKYRLEQEKKIMPINFLRHYYDVYKLLENSRVLEFLGSEKYVEHKKLRFRGQDEVIIKNNPAFSVEDVDTSRRYNQEFIKKSPIYFGKQPTFDEIIERIQKNIDRL
jgi:predicted nucleotidyltransferase component of viral defense system